MASFMEVLQTSSRSQKFSTIAYTGSLFQVIIYAGPLTNKEVQEVIDTINDGTLYLRGFVRNFEERVQIISRYMHC